MKKIIRFQKISINHLCIFITILILAFACKKEDEIGAGIQPLGDKLYVSQADSFKINTSLVLAQPIITSNSLLNIAGELNDPVFGKSLAGFYTQFSLPTSNVSFHDLEGNSPILDSLVLVLKYTDCFGNKNDALTFHVFELTEDLTSEDIYSNKEFNRASEDLAGMPFLLCPEADSLATDKEIRIPLSSSLGEKFLQASGSSDLESNENFKSFFKGLFISANSQPEKEGNMGYFDLNASEMILYYNDSLEYSISIDDECIRANNFQHDYTNATLISQQLNDSSKGNQTLFLQPHGGIKGRISIPNLQELNKLGNLVINNAELIMFIDEEYASNTFTLPEKLALKAIDNEGNSAILIDQIFNSIKGELDLETNSYSFNITRHAQDIMDSKISNNGFFLSTYGSDVLAERAAIFGGDTNNASPMLLKLSYTIIN